jgi:DNA repair protein RadC
MGYGIETFAVTTFKENGQIINSEVISKGDMSSVPLTTKSIVQHVLKYKAPCAVISHNHVVGGAVPSEADIRMTIGVKTVLEQIGVRLLDHVIVADGDYVSLAQSPTYKSIFIIK